MSADALGDRMKVLEGMEAQRRALEINRSGV